MKLFRCLVLLIFLCGVFLCLQAETMRYITMRDGLSSRQVYELEEDADGFIWMYTNSGLERYDGYRFRHYPLEGSVDSNDHLASATTMRQGPDGMVWVATKSGLIYKYDKDSDQFVKQIEFKDKSVSLYHFALLPDGRLVAAANDGIYLCAPGEVPVRIALAGIFVSTVLPHDDGVVYAGTDSGVYKIDMKRGNTVTKYPGTDGVYVKSLAVASGKLYVGPFADSVFPIDLTSGKKLQLPFPIPKIPVNAMETFGSETLLIGIDGAGVYKVDSRTGALLHHYRDGDGSPQELSGNTVTDILVDEEGGVWISTTHSGVNYLPPSDTPFRVIKPERGNSNSLISGHINAVFEDSSGEIWFGTDKGVSRYNPTSGKWKHYLQNHDYSANVIIAIGEDADGNIWVGSYGEGAACIDKKTDAVTHLPALSADGKTGIGTGYLFTSFRDSRGDLWFGGINGLTTRYDTKNDTYHYYDEDCIGVATEGRDGKVVFGGNKGVGVYDPKTDKVTWSAEFDSVTIRYPVRSLLVDTLKSEIWIGTTGEGLVRYNYATNTVKRFTPADGLSSNVIYTLLRDKLDGTWICTENDVYRFNPKTETIGCFTNFVYTENKFDKVSFNPCGTVTRDGFIYLGTPEGVITFNPFLEAKNPVSTRLMFTDLILNDVRVTPGGKDSPLTRNIDLVESLQLDHKYNNMAIDFAIINIKSPHRLDYEYMLEGYDSDFKKADATRRARYSGLDPGKYKLKVRAIDLYSSAVIDERELPIVIKGPWWQTWWARLSYGVIILTLVVLCIGYLRNRRREKRIENQIRTFANIAHDIRTPMSMIKAPLINVEQERGLSDGGRRNLTLARAGIEKTLDMLTAMLELPGGDMRQEELHVGQCDIRDFMREKCESFMPLAMLKGLELKPEIAPDMPATVVTDSEKLSHVIDNLLSNAIKYTFTGSVTLKVAPYGDKRWRLTVSDTGIGISKTDRRRLFNYRHRGSEAVKKNIPGTGMGLLITKRLVRLLRGRISFESVVGRGTDFIVTLPLQYAGYSSEPVPAASPTVDEIPEAEAQCTQNRIFIIDDDADMREFLLQALSEEYSVTVFSDTTEILDRIRTDNPDMVIADVMMPRLRGDELCRIIKTDIVTSHIPVILLSGLTARRDVVSGLEAHADDYIVKPFDLILLKARIRNIIMNRQRLGRQVLAEDSKPEEAEFTSELDRQFMVSVMEKINENLSDSEFAVGDLCAGIGMSRTSVYNKIRSMTGQSVNEFIRIVRLNKAKELLSSGQHNVSEVAYMVGFSDPKYFSTCFKKQFGVSPSKLN